ncbi:hypothetical protein NQ314_003112 [Rhamnusium bicolor]|uniref:Uncharacterized protein n=1 Tax=Rhamnusium bicolor TaxID=1586634 RepID=A0AAV8ZMU0_9CUCU|nr:hypothetical protein NQ314_003112 [Rhamnusium bicolor]
MWLKKGDEKKLKEGHKKGHTVKGYKTSHQKDENSKTEEFYDEEHDEAGKEAFSGQNGQFGEKKDLSFKGEKADKEFKAGEQKKDGHYGQKYLQDKEKQEKGEYGKKKYAGDQSVYKLNKEGDAKKAGGHHESSNLYKHYPIHY